MSTIQRNGPMSAARKQQMLEWLKDVFINARVWTISAESEARLRPRIFDVRDAAYRAMCATEGLIDEIVSERAKVEALARSLESLVDALAGDQHDESEIDRAFGMRGLGARVNGARAALAAWREEAK